MAVTGYNNYTYRWRAGFVNAAQLTSDYNLVAFPRQSDMDGGTDWLLPQGFNTYNEASITESALSNRGKFLGDANFSWTLPRLTPLMTNYILHNAALFNGAAYLDSTVSTWNGARNRWEIVWAIARVGTTSERLEPGFQRGFVSMTITFQVEQDAP